MNFKGEKGNEKIKFVGFGYYTLFLCVFARIV
jgi:hypothetical protein